MKLTKFVHSCLLAETESETVLFDPGQFSWESGLFDVNAVNKLSAIVITHEHYDHLHLPFVQALTKKFPEVVIVTPNASAKILKEAGITNITTDNTSSIKIFSRKLHASLDPLGPAPENIAVHFAGSLTVGGDRHDLEESMSILTLPVTAPWGSMTAAAAMACRLRPKHIIPIHDWHWNETARAGAYQRLKDFFAEQGITFHPIQDGVALEVQL